MILFSPLLMYIKLINDLDFLEKISNDAQKRSTEQILIGSFF